MIVLVGYMGSGKTTLGKRLAKELGVEFIDLDKKIEERTGKNIPQIFKLYGEYFFRKMEYLLLKESLIKREGVIATGGGAPTFYNSMSLINENATSVYIKVPVSELLRRLKLESDSRPIISGKSDEELSQFLKDHLTSRESYYSKANHIIENLKIEKTMIDLRKIVNP